MVTNTQQQENPTFYYAKHYKYVPLKTNGKKKNHASKTMSLVKILVLFLYIVLVILGHAKNLNQTKKYWCQNK